jgi:hypothetical protein
MTLSSLSSRRVFFEAFLRRFTHIDFSLYTEYLDAFSGFLSRWIQLQLSFSAVMPAFAL